MPTPHPTNQPVKILDNAALCQGAVGHVVHDSGGPTVDVSVAHVGTVRVGRGQLVRVRFDRGLGEWGEFVTDDVDGGEVVTSREPRLCQVPAGQGDRGEVVARLEAATRPHTGRLLLEELHGRGFGSLVVTARRRRPESDETVNDPTAT